jgi:hypothetical protein
MEYVVSKTAKDDVLVQQEDGWVASRVSGQWSDKYMFDAYQEWDELKLVTDKKEAADLWKQAHQTLETRKLMGAA